jgi:hypothetical protein
VLHRLFLLFALLVFAFPLRAQNDPVKMTPEFPLTFPLAQNGTDVTVKFPVLINPGTIIQPGMVLRVMYILHSANADGSSDLALAHKGDLESSFSRPVSSDDGKAKLPPEIAHEIEGYRRMDWQVANNFILAMAQYPTDQMHLIYVPAGDKRDLRDERFSFFDGLMVGLPDGRVTVLAVETDSYADHAGLKGGDEIVSIGGIPVQNDLAKYSTAFATTKKEAHEDESASYPMVIRSAGKNDIHTVNVSMPPTLKGGLMQGF